MKSGFPKLAASTFSRVETNSPFGRVVYNHVALAPRDLTAEEIASLIPPPDSIGESFHDYRARSLKSPTPKREKAVRLAWRAEPAWYHRTKKPLAFNAKTGDWTAPEFRGLS